MGRLMHLLKVLQQGRQWRNHVQTQAVWRRVLLRNHYSILLLRAGYTLAEGPKEKAAFVSWTRPPWAPSQYSVALWQAALTTARSRGHPASRDARADLWAGENPAGERAEASLWSVAGNEHMGAEAKGSGKCNKPGCKLHVSDQRPEKKGFQQ